MEPQARFMEEAVREAAGGRGITHPNPSVGAVVVREGRVVGRGFHRGPGTPHAEVVALLEAGERAKGADLYVTLEPCNTFGRTPPCTRAIFTSGIGRVVAAVADPNPLVSGGGAEELRRQGIPVVLPFLEDSGRSVDRAYHAFYALGRPFVHLKYAVSVDGHVTAPRGAYLTGPEARERVHEDRFENDAILVSAGTVIADDPRLTVRLDGRKKPLLRVLLDRSGRLTGKERVFGTAPEGGPILVVRGASCEGGMPASRENVEWVRMSTRPEGGFDLPFLLRRLAERRVMALYVEAVGRLAGSLLREGWVDRLSVHVAPVILGGEATPPPVAEPLPGPGGGGLRPGRARWELAGPDAVWTADLEGRCLRDS
jgi:diaminohydroxyphosphoribosylaminopyrimidine deaminase/5-amino-6-(5-phosphoribosylamino)uracil reductase